MNVWTFLDRNGFGVVIAVVALGFFAVCAVGVWSDRHPSPPCSCADGGHRPRLGPPPPEPRTYMGIAIEADGMWRELALKYDRRAHEGPVVYAITDRRTLGDLVCKLSPDLRSWFTDPLPPNAFLCALFADTDGVGMTQIALHPLAAGSEALS